MRIIVDADACPSRDLIEKAAMALGKKAFAISPRGFIYDDSNIERLLFERHLSQKVRRGRGRTPNPKKRNNDDGERLYKNLIKLIKGEWHG